MKEKKFVIPKSLATCADLLYQIREERYALNKQVELLQARETLLREHIINNLPKSSATGISGKIATARIEIKQVVNVNDWDGLYTYIAKNWKKGAFALLQRRVGEAAVKEIWADGKTVPGCGALDIPTVSLTKI